MWGVAGGIAVIMIGLLLVAWWYIEELLRQSK